MVSLSSSLGIPRTPFHNATRLAQHLTFPALRFGLYHTQRLFYFMGLRSALLGRAT